MLQRDSEARERSADLILATLDDSNSIPVFYAVAEERNAEVSEGALNTTSEKWFVAFMLGYISVSYNPTPTVHHQQEQSLGG